MGLKWGGTTKDSSTAHKNRDMKYCFLSWLEGGGRGGGGTRLDASFKHSSQMTFKPMRAVDCGLHVYTSFLKYLTVTYEKKMKIWRVNDWKYRTVIFHLYLHCIRRRRPAHCLVLPLPLHWPEVGGLWRHDANKLIFVVFIWIGGFFLGMCEPRNVYFLYVLEICLLISLHS